MHCRFACIACDHNWLEDLIVGAMDRVEEVVMVCQLHACLILDLLSELDRLIPMIWLTFHIGYLIRLYFSIYSVPMRLRPRYAKFWACLA
jgi:hypothetical protein